MTVTAVTRPTETPPKALSGSAFRPAWLVPPSVLLSFLVLAVEHRVRVPRKES